jgi:hypothetical protein
MLAEQGRLAWQVATGYGQRSLVETTMGRSKALIGPRLRARGFAAEQTGVAIGVTVLNRMLATGRPDSVRRRIAAWVEDHLARRVAVHQRPSALLTPP